MIAPLDLLELLQVRVELLLIRPDRPVDPGELRVPFLAAPVRAGDGEQPERADLPGSLDMRAATEIDEVPVLVDRDLAVGRRRVVLAVLAAQLLDLLDLVGLMTVAEELDRLGDVHLAVLERQVATDRRAHPFLDLRQILVGQRTRQLEVVVEAVGDRRPETELRVGEEIEHRARHDVRGRMPERVQLVGTVIRLAVGLRHRRLPAGTKKRLRPRSSSGREALCSRGSTRVPLVRRSRRLYGACPHRSAVVTPSRIGRLTPSPVRFRSHKRRSAVRVVALVNHTRRKNEAGPFGPASPRARCQRYGRTVRSPVLRS